ncbi:hypothetical protein L914_19127, partial [Phytophthora nicotianae]
FATGSSDIRSCGAVRNWAMHKLQQGNEDGARVLSEIN